MIGNAQANLPAARIAGFNLQNAKSELAAARGRDAYLKIAERIMAAIAEL